MKEIDLSNNGVIDYNEFITATCSRNNILTQKNLQAIFKTLDKDNSGEVTDYDILSIFNQECFSEERKMLEGFLKEYSSKLNSAQFCELMNKIAK